jgi:hypothetical protein
MAIGLFLVIVSQSNVSIRAPAELFLVLFPLHFIGDLGFSGCELGAGQVCVRRMILIVDTRGYTGHQKGS